MADSSLAAAPPHGSLDDVRARLAPVREAVERIRDELRPDSGTAVADSIFLARRGEPDLALRGLAGTLEEPTFQGATGRDGAAAHSDSLVDLMAAHGIEVRRAEGQVAYEVSEAFLLDVLGPYLTSEMREYLELLAREQARPTASDGALTIPLEELAERLRLADRFLADHPASRMTEAVRARYLRYLAIYLGGIENTPAFDRSSKAMDPTWRRSLEAFVADHGESEAGRWVAGYLTLLRASGFTRDATVDAFLRDVWGGALGRAGVVR